MQNPLAALIQDKIVSLAGSSTSQLAKDILAMHPADLVCTSDLAFKAVDIHKSNCHIHILSSHASRKILQKKTYKKYASKYLLVERNLFSVFAKNFRLFSKLKSVYFYRDEHSLGGTIYYCFENKKNPELSSLIYSNLSADELSGQIKEKHFLTLHGGAGSLSPVGNCF
ncbi:MAG: hypothetical protein JKY99_10225 [Rhizobiales bacterium]|nr:hypothetical protein [Hyphomicrobiales bacterium]